MMTLPYESLLVNIKECMGIGGVDGIGDVHVASHTAAVASLSQRLFNEGCQSRLGPSFVDIVSTIGISLH